MKYIKYLFPEKTRIVTNKESFIISPCRADDFDTLYEIINDGAVAYKAIIPDSRWHEPYMPKEELAKQIAEGVEFWGYAADGRLLGVMGIQ